MSDITNDLLSNLQWLKNKHPNIFNEVIENNEYGLSRDSVSGKNIIDIGANVGMFSILAAYLGAKKIIAVEPVTETFNMLKDNVVMSKFNNIDLYKNLVLNVKDAFVTLPIQDESGHNSLYLNSTKYETIKTTTLNDLLMKLPINEDVILKIDCEGSEYDILLNMSKEELTRVKTLHIEIHANMHHLYKGFEILENKIFSFGFSKVREYVMYSYTVDNNGQVLSMYPMPVKICCFEKA